MPLQIIRLAINFGQKYAENISANTLTFNVEVSYASDGSGFVKDPDLVRIRI